MITVMVYAQISQWRGSRMIDARQDLTKTSIQRQGEGLSMKFKLVLAMVTNELTDIIVEK